jgi:uncharacterized membrane protein
MYFRSLKERLFQSILYEISGTLLATVAYAAVFGGGFVDALWTMVALSLAFMIYAPVFNMVFDWVEWRFAHRVASDRPHRLRALHAVLLEGSDSFVSVPILMFLGGHGLVEAIATDFALLALHSVYAYFYFLAFDWLRPVRVPEANPHANAYAAAKRS